MIEIDGLTKRYGDKTAVDRLRFVVEPGVVTGFLGPNGAGKSTTMRMIAGLDRPTTGTVRVNGKHYPEAAAPMSELGILLDARSVHPGLSARNNLLALARTAGIGRRRVDEVIELAGLGEVAGARAGGFSLGMGQRLGMAAALLGQPQTVVLDEPVNGLDPDGVRWIRLLLKSLAAEGRTVFVSSHLMSEMAQTATRLVVLGVLGVLAFSGEFATGMIRATLAVVPSRLPVLWAKLVALSGLVLPLSLLAAVAEFFVATALESSRGGSAISLADPGVLRELVGASLYLTVTAFIGLGLGALLRRTAAGLSVFAAAFFVLPIVAAYLPHRISGFAPYLPSNAGGAIWGAGKIFSGHQLGPWAGFAVLCGYAVVLTGLAAWRLRRRDAWQR
jgi:ABC-2 type transport system ATP-binding protein